MLPLMLLAVFKEISHLCSLSPQDAACWKQPTISPAW